MNDDALSFNLHVFPTSISLILSSIIRRLFLSRHLQTPHFFNSPSLALCVLTVLRRWFPDYEYPHHELETVYLARKDPYDLFTQETSD